MEIDYRVLAEESVKINKSRRAKAIIMKAYRNPRVAIAILVPEKVKELVLNITAASQFERAENWYALQEKMKAERVKEEDLF
jgi:hypothetical protein